MDDFEKQMNIYVHIYMNKQWKHHAFQLLEQL